jgi:hypothetical protein
MTQYGYNSTIAIKKKPCKTCGRERRIFSKGNCQPCAVIARHKEIIEEQKAEIGELDRWFELRRKEMRGICLVCGGVTCKEDDDKYRRSIAHLFAKRETAFPSIATNENNWIELCFFGKSCHTNFDNGILTFETIKRDYPQAWKQIVKKAAILYPLMTNAEKGRVPKILVDEIVFAQGSL